MFTPQKSWWLGFALIIGFWFWILFCDYPAPFLDDTWYVGAAINLAQHGVFSNPRCEALATFGSPNHFFAYMPLHSYVVAAWLKIAGVSTRSFHFFYTGLALLASLLVYRLFPARTTSCVCGLLICVVVYGFLGGQGLRPDALGVVTFLIGVDAFAARSLVSFFVKNFFLGLALIAYPNVALLSLMISVAALIYQWKIQNRPFAELRAWALTMGLAYALCFLIFMICINGLLVEFLRVFTLSQAVSANVVHQKFNPFSFTGVLKWMIVQGYFLVFTGVAHFRWKRNPQRKADRFILYVLLLAFFILGLSSSSSSTGAHLWIFASLMATLCVIARESWRPPAYAVWLIVLVLAGGIHFHVVIEACLADPPPSLEKRQALLAEIARLHPPRLNVDVYAIRELYDYRLPDNAFYFEWSGTRGITGMIDLASLPPNSLSIVSVRNAVATAESPDVGRSARPLMILGHVVPKLIANSYDLEIVDNLQKKP